ncbi:MAG: ABC transporter permease [Clostridia bacterium]|nr:ABC transporter permease [Clostridia bacterium]
MDTNIYEHIPKEKFAFKQLDANIHDQKLETKSRGYFADAMVRFKKNKSSVVAAWIILFLILFAIVSPLISVNPVRHMDSTYTQHPPFIRAIADKNLGIFDGATKHESQSEKQVAIWRAIGEETGLQPVLRIVDTTVQKEKYRGQWRDVVYHKIENNKYYERGVVYRVVSYDEYQRIQDFQNETGVQVIYPYVEPKDIMGIKDNPNIWYQVQDNKGTPLQDEDGNYIYLPAYSTDSSIEGPVPYNSIRIEGDPGNYIYSAAKSGAVHIRICYYNYYHYVNGHEPTYIFGTNSLGQCLFTGIGVGARFSLIFAVIVSAINLTIGAIYGAIQGYYGGLIDLILDRIAEVLGGVPFVVVTTLFQLHLAQKVGVLPSFLFAFVLTGWLGMAALTRKQFYRFKSLEFVLAARTLGASDWRLMFKHIFPNALGTIVTSCALVIPGVISSEVSLTYLGIINLQELFGTSIGTLASQGQTAMTAAPHAMLFPSIFISLLLISFNLFGNGLRDAFNPSTRGVED